MDIDIVIIIAVLLVVVIGGGLWLAEFRDNVEDIKTIGEDQDELFHDLVDSGHSMDDAADIVWGEEAEKRMQQWMEDQQ